MKKIFLLGVFSTLFVTPVWAIPPPDFIISSLQSVLQLFGVVIAFFISLFFLIHDFVKTIWQCHRKKCLMFIGVLLIIGVLLGLYIYTESQKKWKKNVDKELKELSTIIIPKTPTNIQLPQEHKELQKNTPKEASIKVIDDQKVFEQIWDKFHKVNEAGTQTENKIFQNNDFKISVGTMNNLEPKIIIDLREAQAQARGYIPKSIFLRLTDFLMGDWKKLNLRKTDTIIFVCFTGSRGSLATEFFRELGFNNAYYLEGGINKSIKNKNFHFEGQPTLGSPDNIQRLLNTDEVRTSIKEGGIGIDVRSDTKFNKKHLPNSISFFRDGMRTETIKETLKTFDTDKKYFAICDSWLNCYSAKILGFEMAEFNLTFIGRYAKPYKYSE